MGVEVEDMQVGIAPASRPHTAQGHQMLSADEQGQFAVCEDLLRPGLDVRQSRLGAAEAKLQIAAVKHGAVGQVLILIGTVRLQAEALVAHGGGAEPGAGAKAGGGVKGCTEEDNLRFLVAALAADECFDIGVHFSTSSSISSKNAGRKNAPV